MSKKKKSNQDNFFIKNYDQISFVITSILSFCVSILESFIYEKLSTGKDHPSNNTSLKILLLLSVLIIIIIASFISKKIKIILLKDGNYNKFIDKAYHETQQLALECQSQFQEICNRPYKEDDVLTWISNSMQNTIDRCYSFFCNSFDTGHHLVDDMSFEVTFMTKSHRDDKITIPYSCNKEHRTPTSMLLREDKADIYDETVTAEIYNEYEYNRKTKFKLIPDTLKSGCDNGHSYKFIYNDQESRIKSTIVIPVLSHRSELLGTIVVHCNVTNFFKKNKEKFWEAIMQAFSSEMGKYMLMLNYFKSDDKSIF